MSSLRKIIIWLFLISTVEVHCLSEYLASSSTEYMGNSFNNHLDNSESPKYFKHSSESSDPIQHSSAVNTDNITYRSDLRRRKIKRTNPLSSSENVEIPLDPSLQFGKSHATKFISQCNMPTDFGDFKMRSYTYDSLTNYLEPIVMVAGDVANKQNVIVRVHDQCFTSEVFGSKRCDCRDQLYQSLDIIRREGGVLIYLQQEGRGIGIANKVAAYNLQDQGYDTVDANIQLGFKDELREYRCIPDILKDLHIESIQLLTNNPFKVDEIKKLGVNVVKRLPIIIPPNKHNFKYMYSKRVRMNHIIPDMVNEYQESFSSDSLAFNVPQSSPTTQPTYCSNSDDSNEVNHNLFDFVSVSNEIRREYALGKHTVLAAIEALKRGEIIIVVDDENRENEGDLIMAAEMATADKVGFIVRHSSGVICMSMESERLDELKLPPMVINNEDPKQTAYTISVDYKHGTTTGISSYDRALCFNKLVDSEAKVSDFQRPGHVFPLRYSKGGVLVRGGHTEASLDFCKLAGLKLGGVLAEVVNDDGSLKRLPDLQEMSKEHGLVLTSVQDLIAYRLELQEKK